MLFILYKSILILAGRYITKGMLEEGNAINDDYRIDYLSEHIAEVNAQVL